MCARKAPRPRPEGACAGAHTFPRCRLATEMRYCASGAAHARRRDPVAHCCRLATEMRYYRWGAAHARRRRRAPSCRPPVTAMRYYGACQVTPPPSLPPPGKEAAPPPHMRGAGGCWLPALGVQSAERQRLCRPRASAARRVLAAAAAAWWPKRGTAAPARTGAQPRGRPRCRRLVAEMRHCGSGFLVLCLLCSSLPVCFNSES